ncbi:PLD nuclease N-terminal domain-containing protein [Psychrobacillus sp. NEAU-3TGS]|uniref:PLD nuclease N-terminal domain-containing protein n=1 Tax=Psychrobacillus sp. NEAU-3TGS TaxID=2995412 RepID=UPI002498699B|nr:PLD nuclease N-terminal domain-containing protein [Psychrobacillus sp. NEAU-3TGS]MDI2587466.1 PLD nuclease N-terminal domain-containing protein [Psychrobacillus sp. NEAU-3TGS]
MDLESIPWMLILPFIIIQLILMLVAIIDLTRVSNTNGPKWLWALIIVLGNLIGPIIYFIVGRRNE